MIWQRLEQLRKEQGSPKTTNAERPSLRIQYGPPPGWKPKAEEKTDDEPQRVIIIDL